MCASTCGSAAAVRRAMQSHSPLWSNWRHSIVSRMLYTSFWTWSKHKCGTIQCCCTGKMHITSYRLLRSITKRANRNCTMCHLWDGRIWDFPNTIPIGRTTHIQWVLPTLDRTFISIPPTMLHTTDRVDKVITPLKPMPIRVLDGWWKVGTLLTLCCSGRNQCHRRRRPLPSTTANKQRSWDRSCRHLVLLLCRCRPATVTRGRTWCRLNFYQTTSPASLLSETFFPELCSETLEKHIEWDAKNHPDPSLWAWAEQTNGYEKVLPCRSQRGWGEK